MRSVRAEAGWADPTPLEQVGGKTHSTSAFSLAQVAPNKFGPCRKGRRDHGEHCQQIFLMIPILPKPRLAHVGAAMFAATPI